MRNSRKQSQKTASHGKMRTKIIALFGTLFIIAGAVMAWFMFSNSKNAPRFEVSVTAPAPTAFDNNINADFVGPNALPEVNNNRELGAPGELVILYEQVSGDYVPALRMGADDAEIGKKNKNQPRNRRHVVATRPGRLGVPTGAQLARGHKIFRKSGQGRIEPGHPHRHNPGDI